MDTPDIDPKLSRIERNLPFMIFVGADTPHYFVQYIASSMNTRHRTTLCTMVPCGRTHKNNITIHMRADTQVRPYKCSQNTRTPNNIILRIMVNHYGRKCYVASILAKLGGMLNTNPRYYRNLNYKRYINIGLPPPRYVLIVGS